MGGNAPEERHGRNGWAGVKRLSEMRWGHLWEDSRWSYPFTPSGLTCHTAPSFLVSRMYRKEGGPYDRRASHGEPVRERCWTGGD
jgi:hypothetical protein